MFFIGVFGIETKSKEIKDINNITCKHCGRLGAYKLIKKYSFFHFFFIPLFKWGEEYFLISRCCNSVFGISKEKGKRLEAGIDFGIDNSDLNYVQGNMNQLQYKCPNCGSTVDSSFEYCPHCGRKL